MLEKLPVEEKHQVPGRNFAEILLPRYFRYLCNKEKKHENLVNQEVENQLFLNLTKEISRKQ